MDKVRGGRRGVANMKSSSAIFGDAIVDGHAFVLTQMFGPRLDNESFDVATRVSGIGI